MDYEQMIAQLSKILTPKRLQHSIGVSETAEELAGIFGCDKGKARVAGLLHDVAREIPVDELLSRAEAFGIVMSDIERAEPILLHAFIAAKLAQSDFCINDAEIFQAICLHTIGGLHMSLLDKIIYVADAIEPGRQYEDLEELRAIARIDLDKALLMTLDQSIQYILKRGGLLHPATIEARNELLIKKT
ncbi:bis(5'-nucleosyl)-tetraphosphatase (symmetrical) YqeK [Pelosinus sp. IPA-1]|uniref:bis(5'-nucleosyl)-tetraphosphatase (symmetrical) YqeK n=1 Tax=Pelosinus sp. IPA-1 TaxID=3029569 RepID=UPI0024361DAA|nr:bis(5'-nucleosyl)-tetraphosphatase (symmetrical) YqeK [Pelosinus sp. IPA-1]GMB00661.1 phosphohydrolase [Pelosinus sp. IPA-1]